MAGGYGGRMERHGLAIAPDDRDALERAGIRMDLVPPGPGRRGGTISLPLGPGADPLRVTLALVRDPGGPWVFGVLPGAGSNVMAEIDLVALREPTPDDLVRLGLLGASGTLADECLMFIAGESSGLDWTLDTTDPSFGPGHIDETFSDAIGYRPDGGRSALFRSAEDEPGWERSMRRSRFDRTLEAAMRRGVSAWSAAMATMLSPHGPTPLRASTWSPVAAAMLADPVHGPYRMQAVALYPALAPFIVGASAHPAVIGLVDAGRPFERALLAAVREWLLMGRDASPGLDLVRLRRARTMPGNLWGQDIHALLMASTELAPEAMPSSEEEWRSMAARLRAVKSFATKHGLSPVRLAVDASSDWKRSTMELNQVLDDASDMRDSLHHGVIGPSLVRHVHKESDRLRIAGLMLFGDRRLADILDAAERWHARGIHLTRSGAGLATWPALFPDFEAGGGIRIACLTSTADLLDEGGDGPDARGDPGLAHCIATYAGRCAEGSVHVASVHRPHDGGRRTRMATVSLRAAPSTPGMRVEVDQIRGRANAVASPEVFAAVRALAADLQVRPFPEMAPATLTPTGMEGRETEIARLLAAWSPYLPKRHRVRTPEEALRLMLRLRARLGDR